MSEQIPDWADEIALKLEDEAYSQHGLEGAQAEEVATALRKAKADGMREAAAMLQACDRCIESDHVHGLLDRAEHIERSEA